MVECEWVIVSMDVSHGADELTSIIGIFTDLAVPEFPFHLELYVTVRLSGDPGDEFEMAIDLVPLVPRLRIPFSVIPTTGIYLNSLQLTAEFHQPGLYQVEVSLNGLAAGKALFLLTGAQTE